MDRKKIKNSGKLSKSDVDLDSNLFIYFNNESEVLPFNNINYVLNSNKQFTSEREQSKIYRFSFTLSPLFSNCLYNIRGNTNLGVFGTSNIQFEGNGLETFESDLFSQNPYDDNFTGVNDYNYQEAVNVALEESNGWFGFKNPDLTAQGDCDFYDLEPTRRRFDLTNTYYNNWDYTIIYPKRMDKENNLIKGGLLITDIKKITIGLTPMIAIGTSTFHGLSVGDYVTLSNISNVELNGKFRVIKLGLEDNSLQNNYIVIRFDASSLTINNTSGRLRKNVNGILSEYYIRIGERLTFSKNYDIYKLSFAKTIYDDNVCQLVFNEDVNIEGLTDNLGRPISELFLTTIKTDSNKIFNSVNSGIDLEFTNYNLTNDVNNVRMIHDSTTNVTNTPLETNINANTNEFMIDIVEYNNLTLIETPLNRVLHRFNTKDRENPSIASNEGPRKEGYLFKPHNKLKIREFSSYIEQGTENTINPDYAVDLGDGRLIWRDYLSLGVTTNNDFDYPFTNNAHYIHKTIVMGTNRQDPYSNYGLYFKSIFPENDGIKFIKGDPLGDALNEQIKINIPNETC